MSEKSGRNTLATLLAAVTAIGGKGLPDETCDLLDEAFDGGKTDLPENAKAEGDADERNVGPALAE